MHRKLRHCEHHKANTLSNTECIALEMEVSAGKYAYVCLAPGTAELVHLQSALARTHLSPATIFTRSSFIVNRKHYCMTP